VQVHKFRKLVLYSVRDKVASTLSVATVLSPSGLLVVFEDPNQRSFLHMSVIMSRKNPRRRAGLGMVERPREDAIRTRV
jgi:hypothetical protein